SSTAPAVLNLNSGGYNITKVGTNEVALVHPEIDPSLGNVEVQEGEFAIQDADSGNWLGVGDSTKTITVHSNATLETYNLTDANPLNKLILLQDGSTIQNDSGDSVISGQVTLQGNDTFNVNAQFIFNNVLDGSGNLIKIADSTLVLSATNTYSGATVVSNGTVQVDGSIAGSGVDVEGGTLAGTGSITAPVVINTGGALSPGDNSIGVLSIANTLTLSGTNMMDLDKTSGVLTSDLITNVTALTLGGMLQLNVTGDTALAVGDSFTLFSAGSITGSFSGIIPAVPGDGLQWDTSELSSGILKVATAAAAGPTIGGVAVSGGNVTFNITGGSVNAGATFYVLTSTNVATPLSNWMPVTTNQLDSNGNFSFTNTVSGQPQQFYIIQLP
ncbi:MAG: autotransporter-associated beta strand repeat-containing protein, partial [Limisphaerales bacterium]